MNPEKLLSFPQGTGFVTAGQAGPIAAEFGYKTLRRHEYLRQAGSSSDDYFFLEVGCVRADSSPRAKMPSFFQRTPSQEYLPALPDCAGWGISHAQFNALLHARPKFWEFGRTKKPRPVARG